MTHFETQPEPGDFDDNITVFNFALKAIRDGDDSGRSMLAALAAHIESIRDEKSRVWLLPRIVRELV